MDGFQYPKKFKPHLANLEKPKSRAQQLMSELGIDEAEELSSTSSDSDHDLAPEQDDLVYISPQRKAWDEAGKGYKALKEEGLKKLEERRDELRLMYQEQLDLSHRREVQVKMMKQVHQEAILIKDRTIQNLTDMIAESEERVTRLEGKSTDQGHKASKEGGLQKLVHQISKLTSEVAQLKIELEMTRVDLEKSREERLEVSRKLLHTRQGRPEECLTPRTTSRQIEREMADLAELKIIVQENTSLVREVSALKRDKMSLEEERGKMSQQMVQLLTQLEEMDVECGGREQEVTQLKKEIVDKNDEVFNWKSRCQESEEGRMTLQEQCSILTEALESSQEENALLSRKLQCGQKYWQDQARSLQQQLDNNKAQYEASLCHLQQQLKSKRVTTVALAGSVLKPSLLSTSASLHSLKASIEDAKEDLTVLHAIIPQQIAVTARKIALALAQSLSEKRLAVEKCRREIMERQRLHRQLAELRGRIRVLVRVRPVIKEDGDSRVVAHVDTVDDSQLTIKRDRREKTFSMDRAFSITSTQQEVYNEVRDVILSVADGFSVCIFAYGQTGSGKTYTMEGTAHQPGVNQRAMAELFTVAAERSPHWLYQVHLSMVEVYRERVYDLLGAESMEEVQIKLGNEGNHLAGVTWMQVEDMEEANRVFQCGQERRTTATTTMNIESSRSHCIVCLHVEGYNTITGIRSVGRLNLVDLAGSERVAKSGATGVRLKEAQSINRSLSALGDVIHALQTRQSHVPYRNSKLTHLLRDCLSGDSKVLMFIQLSPVEANLSESLCSLAFAERTMGVELGRAKPNRRAVTGSQIDVINCDVPNTSFT